MKRIAVCLLLAALAPTAFAGLAYRFESVSTGLLDQTMRGLVETDGTTMRISIEKGDGAAFPDGSYAIAPVGGSTIRVFVPSTKSWYEISLQDLQASGSRLLAELRSVMNVSVKNPRVAVRDIGPGAPMEGYETRRRSVTISYEIALAAPGTKNSTVISTTTESWTTDRIPASYTSALQNLHTGMPEVDRLLESRAAAMSGFPIRQVSTTRIVQAGGATTEVRTTTAVKAIRETQVPAARFAAPSGYAKTVNPIEKALAAFGLR